jgi:glycine/D-amino acid oxidase-like deaminating enzyme
MGGVAKSRGLWEKTASPAPATWALSGSVQTDVAIIGAGFTGLSAALHLARAGAKVTVIEGANIGFGGSGRNVGLVNAGLWLPPDDVERALGKEHGRAIIDMLGAAPDLVYGLIGQYEIECEATRTGTLHCAVGESGWRDIEQLQLICSMKQQQPA